MRVEQVTPNKPPDAAVRQRPQPAPAGAAQGAEREAAPESPAPRLEQQLAAAIAQANRMLELHNRSFQFTVHEPTREIIVRVIDTETEEVVKEIPPEEILDLVARLWELAGLFVDERR